MMNAELVKAGQSKIMIPTVFREDYMGVLKKMTRQRVCGPYIRMLQKAHAFSATVTNENMDEMQHILSQCNAFLESSEGKLQFPEA